ncbi:TadE/TadG family type IV pilus assembly protein [Streptomyces sp. NPDC001904]|uniref:TadE/TadG family type IV pilus assembly protein n=1 Tax=Streptomyces sp. NPDC001904 TaxID=3154531 RepID=UPI00331E8B88
MIERFTGRERDRGDAPIEAAIVVPLLIALALLVVAGARLSLSGHRVDAAAQAAARAASLERSPGAGRSAAVAAAEHSLSQDGQSCASTSVRASTSGLAVPVGQVGYVTVTVSCSVPLGDLFFLGGGPSARTLTGTYTSVVDAYRERT